MVLSVHSSAAGWKRRADEPVRTGKRLAKAAPGLLLLAALAGCGDTSVGSSLMNWMPGSKPAADTTTADTKDYSKFAEQPGCPSAQIRYGTEMINLYADGKQGDDNSLKYQVNVQRVARDCNQVGDNIVARVGIAGLVVGGPKGAPGKVEIPVRIVAVNGDKVLVTELKPTSVQVQAPDFSGNWSIVETVTIPAAGSADTLIYVGLDDKSKAAAAQKSDAKPRPHKPRPAAKTADPNDPYPMMKPDIPQ
jgi:hypothetical protein